MDLSNLSLSELQELSITLKEQIKITKEREQNNMAEYARSQGIAVTDTVMVRMANGDTVEGIVSNVTNKGVTVKIEGRDRALFRAWHLIAGIVSKGEGIPEAPASAGITAADLAEGMTVNFTMKGQIHTGTVKRVGDKTWTASFYDSTTEKVRNLARSYESIVSIAQESSEMSAAV